MKIAILSRSKHLYSTHSLFRAGFRRGHQVEIIDHTRCNLVIEKGAPKIFFEGRELNDIEAIIPRIGASVTGYGAAVIEQFELMGVFTSVRTRALLQSRDKLKCLQKLSMAGIDIPKSFIVYQTSDLGDMLKMLPPGPVIIKLLESTHGAGVIIAESHQSATSIIEAFTKTGKKVLVQEFIEESGGADIRAIVVGGQVVASMRRQAAEGEFRSNLHRGASSVAVQLTEEEEKIVKKAARTMGLDVAGVDLLPSNRGYLVMEVNASPGLEGIENTTGIQVGVKIVDYVAKRASKIAAFKNKK
jgi:ribosomal protein S6--L-glutamate ligase